MNAQEKLEAKGQGGDSGCPYRVLPHFEDAVYKLGLRAIERGHFAGFGSDRDESPLPSRHMHSCAPILNGHRNATIRF